MLLAVMVVRHITTHPKHKVLLELSTEEMVVVVQVVAAVKLILHQAAAQAVQA